METYHQIKHNKVKIDSVDVFYREAGNPENETILFLHGFPSSSFMYRNIMAILSPNYHVIAPDYPGFGNSSTLPVTEFDYTFDNIAAIIEKFIDKLQLRNFNLYMQDYGGPVGFRIASKRPELIKSLLIQNANAYEEGLGPGVQQIGSLIDSGDEAGLSNAINYMISFDGIKDEYVYGAENEDKISPEAYIVDSYYMEKAGVKEIQHVLFRNYGKNFPKYPEWQSYLREHQPKTLIMWGGNDRIFITPGAEAYKRDLPNAKLHVLNGGHFALEEHYTQIAGLVTSFLTKGS
nr:alpha/beta hydrolase [uncultured Mucilaginibacter sp.]